MSEVAQAKKKGGGKLPIIMVVVLALAGGGFFAMSGNKKEAPKEEPEYQLGGIESLGEDFVVNLAGDPNVFVSANISVHGEKDAHIADPSAGKDDGHGGGKKEASYSIARTAVIETIQAATLEDISTPEGLKKLRREMATRINKAIHQVHEMMPSEDGKESSDSKKKKRKRDKDEEEGHHEIKIDHEYLDEIGLDAEEGPVLKVYFNKFVFQKY